MARSRFAILVLILALFLSSTSTYAQQDDNKAALREKAVRLLESVAGQLNTLQSAENRARLGANIVDSLWKHDEKRARALLLLVQEDIIAGLDVKKKLDQTEQHTFSVFSKLRVDTAERVAKHDGEAAFAFFQATAPRSDKALPESLLHNERQLELRLANQVAAANPDAALKVALKSLQQGFSRDLISLLTQLNKKHKEQALILYKEIVQKVKDADLMWSWEAREFVDGLTQYFKPPEADPATHRELATLLTSGAMAKGCATKMNEEDERADYCQWVAALITRMQTLDPRAAKLKHWTADDEPEEQSGSDFDLTEIIRDARPDDVQTLVTKYPEHAENIVVRVLMKLRISGQFEEARQIANRHLSDENRTIFLAELDFVQKLRTLDEATLAELEATINANEDIEERFGSFMELYRQYGGANPKTALKLLDRASALIDTMKPGSQQSRAQITVATMYCLEKNDRGLSIMESLLPKLNELVDVAAKLDGYDTKYLRDGEWNMSANGATGELLTIMAQHAGHFAWCDFDRAVTLAARFDRNEIRLMAQLKLAQGILAGPPQRVREEIRLFYRH